MEKKIDCVLLIDDDDTTNFLHELTLQKAGVAHQIVIAETVHDALHLLETMNPVVPASRPVPDLIFLDLNLPGLTGWEFIEEFKKKSFYNATTPVIIMLTASVNKDDETKAKTIPEIAEFRLKPLTLTMVQEILQKHFA